MILKPKRGLFILVTILILVGQPVAALLKDQVDAVVYDAPNLLYYANGEGRGQVMAVAKKFDSVAGLISLPPRINFCTNKQAFTRIGIEFDFLYFYDTSLSRLGIC
ncbi:MAG: hypothetical protein GY850_09765 [bacterium]|nr:hypothetical protein [bacterium]